MHLLLDTPLHVCDMFPFHTREHSCCNNHETTVVVTTITPSFCKTRLTGYSINEGKKVKKWVRHSLLLVSIKNPSFSLCII